MKKIIVVVLIGLFFTSTLNISAELTGNESPHTPAQTTWLPRYGYIIPIDKDDSDKTQINTCRLINELFKEEITVYWLTTDISVKSNRLMKGGQGHNDFNKGSFLIPVIGDSSIDFKLLSILYKYNKYEKLEIYELTEPIYDIEVYTLVEPNIAYHAGYPTYESAVLWRLYYRTLERCGFRHAKAMDWKVIADELNNEANDFNVFIWGGGHGSDESVIQKIFDALDNTDAKYAIRTFVDNGGGFIGSCYGGYQISKGTYFPWHWDEFILIELLDLLFNIDDVFLELNDMEIWRALPGAGTLKLNIAETDCPVTYGLPNKINTTYNRGPMYLGSSANTLTLATIEDVGTHFKWNQTYNETLGPTLMNIWYNYAKNKPIWVTTNFGEGKAIGFGDHPETCEYRLMYNSLFYVTAEGPSNKDIINSVDFNKKSVEIDSQDQAHCLHDVQFEGIGIDWSPTYWHWDFKDGITSNEQNPIHNYNIIESYEVLLFAGDNDYNIGYDSFTIDIIPSISIFRNYPIWYNKLIGYSIWFDITIENGIAPYVFNWDFGDGTGSNEESPIHTYDEIGIYYGSVEVIDSAFDSDTMEFAVVIHEDYNVLHDDYLMSNFYLLGGGLVIADENDGICNIGEDLNFTLIVSLFYSNYENPDDYIFNISFEDGTYYESDIITPDLYPVAGQTHWILYSFYHNYSEVGNYFPILTLKNLQRNIESTYVGNANVVNSTYNHPSKPYIPDGFNSGKIDTTYYFRTKPMVLYVDPDDTDYITYELDMGDGTIYTKTQYAILYDQFMTCWFYHKWEQPGTYYVKAKILSGENSEWSEPFPVTIIANDENQEGSSQSQGSGSPFSN